MRRIIITWFTLGLILALLALLNPESYFVKIFFILRPQLWLTLIGMTYVFNCFGYIYLRHRNARLAEGDIDNFLPWVSKKCYEISAFFMGFGTFALIHFILTKSGKGLGVFLVCSLFALGFVIFNYYLKGIRESI